MMRAVASRVFSMRIPFLRELQDAGAIRVYEDPADVLRHIDEIGGRR